MKNSFKILITLLFVAAMVLSVGQQVSAAAAGPVLLSADDRVTTDHTPNFVWEHVADFNAGEGDYYRIQISPREDFSILPINHVVAGAFFAPGVAMINQAYWWRVAAFVNGEMTEWSEVRTLTITGAPGNAQPQAVAPEDGAVTTNRRPTFDWDEVGTAVRYRIQLSTLPGFGVWLVNQTVNAPVTEWTPGINLNYGTYYWRVQAEGGGDSSWFSIKRQIIIEPSVANLAAPTLLSPEDSATIYADQPELQWSVVETATKYVVEVTDPSTVVLGSWEQLSGDCDLDDCTFTIPTGLGSDYGTYTWKVKAQNATQDGDWSGSRAFVYTKPGSVTLVSPENPTITADTSPVLTWNTTTGAATYNLHVKTQAGITLVQDQIQAAYCDDLSGTCTAIPTQEMTDGTWLWQVRAENGANYGDWSEEWQITTNTSVGTEYTFDFEGSLDPESPLDFDPYWIDADDAPSGNWFIPAGPQGRYRGTESAVEGSYNSIAYFNHSFGDAIFEANMRSGGDDSNLGFSIIFHGSFDGSNDLDDGYVVKVSEAGEGILTRFWRIENGLEVESLGEVTWSGDGGEYPSPSDFHLYKLELFGNTLTYSINGNELFTLTGLEESLSDGMFGVDIESGDHNLFVEIEEVTMMDMEVPPVP